MLNTLGTASSSTQVTGELLAASYESPTPSLLTTAILDMQTAYTDASGRADPDFNNLLGGTFKRLNLAI